MVVALGAFESNAQPDRGSGIDPVDHLIYPIAFRTYPCLYIASYCPVESCRNSLFKCSIRKKIASDLLYGELIERHVGIKCLMTQSR